MNLIRRLHTALNSRDRVSFCESCGHVCDASCRAQSIQDKVRDARTRWL